MEACRYRWRWFACQCSLLIADPFEVAANMQCANYFTEINCNRLTLGNDCDALGFYVSLKRIQAGIAINNFVSKFGISLGKRIKCLRYLSLGEPTHFRDHPRKLVSQHQRLSGCAQASRSLGVLPSTFRTSSGLSSVSALKPISINVIHILIRHFCSRGKNNQPDALKLPSTCIQNQSALK